MSQGKAARTFSDMQLYALVYTFSCVAASALLSIRIQEMKSEDYAARHRVGMCALFGLSGALYCSDGTVSRYSMSGQN